MVEGMEVVSFVEIPDDKKCKGMSIVAGADYLSAVKAGELPNDWKEKLSAFFAQDEILVWKETKKSSKEVNIKSMIYELRPENDSIYMRVAAGSVQNLKPELVTEAFAAYCGIADVKFIHHRLETFANTGTDADPVFVTLDSLGTEIL